MKVIYYGKFGNVYEHETFLYCVKSLHGDHVAYVGNLSRAQEIADTASEIPFKSRPKPLKNDPKSDDE